MKLVSSFLNVYSLRRTFTPEMTRFLIMIQKLMISMVWFY